ncbi:hypothetical protein ACP275_13G151300 [Erythranthe tilingii]
MELDLQNPLTSYEDLQYDAVSSLFSNESDHMSSSLLSFDSSDSRFSIRRSAVALLSHAKFSYNLDPLLVYLSVNYVDRFLSKQQTLEKKPWIAQILVVASLSLAAKMRNSDLSLPISDLQREEGFEFESQSVRRMETILLSTLQWRMRSITPFSFLQYFISLMKTTDDDDDDDSSLTQCLNRRASDLIFNVQHEMELLEYKPSIISASALLCAVHGLTPLMFSSCEAAISSSEYVNRGVLLECVGAMQEISMEGYQQSSLQASSASGTVTPISVFDWQGTSSVSEEGTTGNSVKRRRLNGSICDSITFQISQIQRC